VGDEVPVAKRVTTVRDLGGYFPAPVRASYTPPPPGAAASVAPRPSGPQVRVTRGVETKSYTVTR
jgi:hypothetical protein